MSDRRGRPLKEERWSLLYRTAYTLEVGRRLLRLREVKGLTQCEARHKVKRPRGGPYSQSTLSRLESGYANAPLYVYIHFAEAYGTDPARLLGQAETERELSSAEMTLVKLLRRAGITVDEAIATLLG